MSQRPPLPHRDINVEPLAHALLRSFARDETFARAYRDGSDQGRARMVEHISEVSIALADDIARGHLDKQLVDLLNSRWPESRTAYYVCGGIIHNVPADPKAVQRYATPQEYLDCFFHTDKKD